MILAMICLNTFDFPISHLSYLLLKYHFKQDMKFTSQLSYSIIAFNHYILGIAIGISSTWPYLQKVSMIVDYLLSLKDIVY